MGEATGAKDIYRVSYDGGMVEYATYQEAFTQWAACVADREVDSGDLWEISGGSAMELCKFKRVR